MLTKMIHKYKTEQPKNMCRCRNRLQRCKQMDRKKEIKNGNERSLLPNQSPSQFDFCEFLKSVRSRYNYVIHSEKGKRERMRNCVCVCMCVCMCACINRSWVVGTFMCFFITLLGPETLLGLIVRTML